MTRTIPKTISSDPLVWPAADYSCLVIPIPNENDLIRRVAALTSEEFAHFAKEVGALRRLKNGHIDEAELLRLVGE